MMWIITYLKFCVSVNNTIETPDTKYDTFYFNIHVYGNKFSNIPRNIPGFPQFWRPFPKIKCESPATANSIDNHQSVFNITCLKNCNCHAEYIMYCILLCLVFSVSESNVTLRYRAQFAAWTLFCLLMIVYSLL